jgi:hypothetical protein
MPIRIFESRNRAGSYLIMLVAGAAMFGMFYFITFFVQLVKDFGPLKTGVAFLPVAFVIGIVSQVASVLMVRVGPRVLTTVGSVLLTFSLAWLSQVDAHSSYFGMLLPGMLVLAVAMGCLFVPLTVTAVSKVQGTDAGLASALLNVGQQVGGALGLSVMTTVFGTAARNYASDHRGALQRGIDGLPDGLRQPVFGRISSAGSNGLQSEDIKKFIDGLPAGQRPAATSFFDGPYHSFSHALIAHASGQGFLTGAVFGVVAIVAAVFLINVKKDELPVESSGALVVA